MQSLTVVHGLDELGDGGFGVFEVLVLAGVDLLPFERLHEAFGHGVVIGAAGAAAGEGKKKK